MRPSTQSPARPIAEKMEILTVARELWIQAGQPRGRLGDFWEMAAQRFAAGGHAPANHFITTETPLPGQVAAD
jgi:hypothetical protein